MDTTYFGRCFGVMLFKDAYSGKNLHKVYVKTETNQQYADGIGYLLKHGFIIKAIVCDGPQRITSAIPCYTHTNVSVPSGCNHKKIPDKEA
jgi:hypothetical protein